MDADLRDFHNNLGFGYIIEINHVMDGGLKSVQSHMVWGLICVFC